MAPFHPPDSLVGVAGRARQARPELADMQLPAVDEARQRYEDEQSQIVLS